MYMAPNVFGGGLCKVALLVLVVLALGPVWYVLLYPSSSLHKLYISSRIPTPCAFQHHFVTMMTVLSQISGRKPMLQIMVSGD